MFVNQAVCLSFLWDCILMELSWIPFCPHFYLPNVANGTMWRLQCPLVEEIYIIIIIKQHSVSLMGHDLWLFWWIYILWIWFLFAVPYKETWGIIVIFEKLILLLKLWEKHKTILTLGRKTLFLHFSRQRHADLKWPLLIRN